MINNDVSVRLKATSKLCDIKIPNGMNRINEKEVNKISECYLLHDILDPSKLTQTINSNY